MRRTRILLVLTFMAFVSGFVKAEPDSTLMHIQDSVYARSLIISEIMMADRQADSWVYAEFANTSDTATLDLSRYFTWSTWHNNVWNSSGEMSPTSGRRVTLSGTLAPGEAYLLVRREHNAWTDPYGNLLYPNGYTNPEAEKLADMIRTRQNPVEDPETFGPRSVWCEWRIGLMYINQITEFGTDVWPDSVFIDRFGPSKDDYPDGNADSEGMDAWRFPIAGLASSGPRRAAVYVRKYGVLKGNTVEGEPNDYPTIEWDNSRGTDLDDSEWIPLPRSMDNGFDKIFTTLGYHGPSPDFDVKSDVAIIDEANKTITIPSGISRDSVFRIFETGINHAWSLKLGADTGQYFVQSDDSIFFYTAGEKMNVYKFGIVISDAGNAFAQVAPLVYKNDNDAFVRNYDISNGLAPMDTIGRLPFDYPVDTFEAYTVFPEGSTWKILPEDGIERPEIKNGDKLEVTAADGTTKKEYFLGVESFFPNHNATLSSIYFPGLDIFENPETFDLTDTLIGFASGVDFYSVNLESDVLTSPAIVATPSNGRSTVEIKRATNLKGSQEDRTATIVVTAEDDTTIMEYQILFNVEREQPPIQGSLFITDYAAKWQTGNEYNVQLYNPSADMVDLTEYALVALRGQTGYGAILTDFALDSNWQNNNKHIFRFGSIVEPAEDGTPVFKTDLNQRKVLLEGNSSYVMASKSGYPMTYAGTNESDKALADKYVDMVWHGKEVTQSNWATQKGWLLYAPYRWGSIDPYNSNYLPFNGFTPNLSWMKYAGWGAQRFGIVRILNDSIKDGLKHVFKSQQDFEADYEWVDIFGGVNWDQKAGEMYDGDSTVISFVENIEQPCGLYRKPYVYKGNPVDGLSFGLRDESAGKTILKSEWVAYGWNPETGAKNNDENQSVRNARFGTHTMITYAHIPYLTSSVYLMGEGLSGQQDIAGVLSGTRVNDFMANVNLPDTGMVVTILASDGTKLEADDVIQAGTNVWSKSANGMDSVHYVITTLGKLDNLCELTSTKYTVVTTAPTGKISGISIGTTLETILQNVSIPDDAILNVTDGNEEIIPLYKYSNDTLSIQDKIKTATLASEAIYLEVVAQDKVTKCLYSIEFNAVDMPFLLSDVYVIDEVEKVINFVGRTSPATFLSNIVVSPGATAMVVNKLYQERKVGTLEFSDRILVTKGDTKVTYWLKFTSEEEMWGVANPKHEANHLSVYPNPTTDFVTVSGVEGSLVEVRDLAGKLMKKQEAGSSHLNIDMRPYVSGIYIVSVKNDLKNYSFKVIKE